MSTTSLSELSVSDEEVSQAAGVSELGFYLSNIRRYTIPTPDEELHLLQRVAKGDGEAREELVARNLRLPVLITSRVLRKRKPLSLSFLDLVQVGNIGLMTAVDRFDLSRGGRLSTYAAWWIQEEVLHSLKWEDRQIRLPNHEIGLLSKYFRERSAFLRTHGREPRDSELAAILDKKPAVIQRIRLYQDELLSIDTPVKDDRSGACTLVDMIPTESASPEECCYQAELRSLVNELLRELSPLEKEILFSRAGAFDAQQSSYTIGEGHGKSRTWVDIKFAAIRRRTRRLLSKRGLNEMNFS